MFPGAAVKGGEAALLPRDVVPGAAAAPFEPAPEAPVSAALNVVPAVLPDMPPPEIDPMKMLPGAPAVEATVAAGGLVAGVPATGAADCGTLTGGCDGGVLGEDAADGTGPVAAATTCGTDDGAAPCAKSHVHDAVVVDPAGCMNPWLPLTLPLVEPWMRGFGLASSIVGNAHSNASAEIGVVFGAAEPTVWVCVPATPPRCRSCACPVRISRRPSEARTRTEIVAPAAGTLVVHCTASD